MWKLKIKRHTELDLVSHKKKEKEKQSLNGNFKNLHLAFLI